MTVVLPIKCQGIKTKLVDWISSHAHIQPETVWIEPFMGSGVVGFNVQPQRAVFADINPHIIHFYQAIQRRVVTPQIVRAYLEEQGHSLSQLGETHYYAVRRRFNLNKDPLDFLFLSRACFNGVMRFNKQGNYNVPFGHKPERFARPFITKVANQIRRVGDLIQRYEWQFICADFRETLAMADETAFIYCDPPYAGRHVDYFNSWSQKDEDDLFDILAANTARFMVSTWHSNKWRENIAIAKYAERFTMLTRQHFYHVGASESNRNEITEALITNFDEVEDVAPVVPQPYQANLFETFHEVR